eukprot:3267252-Rhodomonas_salina.1
MGQAAGSRGTKASTHLTLRNGWQSRAAHGGTDITLSEVGELMTTLDLGWDLARVNVKAAAGGAADVCNWDLDLLGYGVQVCNSTPARHQGDTGDAQ